MLEKKMCEISKTKVLNYKNAHYLKEKVSASCNIFRCEVLENFYESFIKIAALHVLEMKENTLKRMLCKRLS